MQCILVDNNIQEWCETSYSDINVHFINRIVHIDHNTEHLFNGKKLLWNIMFACAVGQLKVWFY